MIRINIDSQLASDSRIVVVGSEEWHALNAILSETEHDDTCLWMAGGSATARLTTCNSNISLRGPAGEPGTTFTPHLLAELRRRATELPAGSLTDEPAVTLLPPKKNLPRLPLPGSCGIGPFPIRRHA